MSDSGQLIKTLREERFLKPSDIERQSRLIANSKDNSDFYISHATLADVEAGSVPSIFKIFSLAVCFRMSYDEMLLLFGVDPGEIESIKQTESPAATMLQPTGLLDPAVQFRLHFDPHANLKETRILSGQPETWGSLPAALLKRIEPRRFTYAVIGLEDDTMGEIIPPGSLVEVDKGQNTVRMFMWRTLRERPIYLVWYDKGYSCSWCQQEGNELIVLPHPASSRPVMKLKVPREATVIGRVVHAWCSFQPGQAEPSGSRMKNLLQ